MPGASTAKTKRQPKPGSAPAVRRRVDVFGSQPATKLPFKTGQMHS